MLLKSRFNLQNNLHVIIVASLAYLGFATHDALSKLAGNYADFATIAIVISLWRALFILGLVSVKHDINLHISSPKAGLLYSVLITIAMVGFYLALLKLPLVELFILLLLRPILVAFLATIFLKERLSSYKLIGLSLGFIAVLVTYKFWNIGALHGNFQYDILGVVGALANLFGMAFAYILIKRSTQTSDIYGLSFFSTLGIAVGAMFFTNWNFELFLNTDLLIISFIAGLVMLIAHLLLLVATQSQFVSSMASAQYSILIWIALYGWVMFGEPVNIETIAGIVLVLGSGIFLVLDKSES